MKKIGIALSLLLCLLLALGGCSAQRRAYRQAQRLMASEKYAQAADVFLSLGDYEDAAERVCECKYLLAETVLQEENPKISDAIRLFEEAGDFGDAKVQLVALKEKYCYDEFDRRVLSLETVLTGAVRAEENGKDENGAYHRYTYTWDEPDVQTLSSRFSAWLTQLDNLAGVDTDQHLNGAFFILVDGERVGLANTRQLGRQVQILVTLYEQPMS